METISNIASTASTTVSNILYGQPEEDAKTGGKEPVSGQQGKGTTTQPYDQGNAETPLATPSAVPGSSNSEDFLKLNPTMGTSAGTDSSTTAKTTGNDVAMPVVPLNPDVATSSGKTTGTSTGAPGASDTEWKPTALDEVKPSGAPGAGPSAPDYTPATPDLSSTDKKESAGTETAKDTVKSEEGAAAKKGPSSKEKDISEIIKPTPEGEHSVPDAEVNDPHSKMTGKTVRNTDATKTTADGEHADDLVKDHAAHKHEGKSDNAAKSSPSTKSPERESGEEKDSKMSHLKEKLKTKLHIGSKDK